MASRHSEYESRTEEILTPIAAGCGVEIYDVEYVKEGPDYYLRAYIDKPSGVTIDDCEAVSRALSDALDAADFIPDAYILEVSSPGLGRKLTKDRHLDHSIGAEVEIKLYKPLTEKGPKEISGILVGYDDRSVIIRDGEAPDDAGTVTADDTDIHINRGDIATIRLALDF